MKKLMIGFGIGLSAGLRYMHAVSKPPLQPGGGLSYATIDEYYSGRTKNDIPLPGSADSSYLRLSKHFSDTGYQLTIDYRDKSIPLYEIRGNLVAGSGVDNLESAVRHLQPAWDSLVGKIRGLRGEE